MRDRDIKDKITEYLELYTELWAFSGSIAVVKGGEILFKNAYGYANIQHNVENTTSTKFKTWSLTKQFTAVVIMMLEERDLLKVEDSIKKYFTESYDLDERITIHHLLTHTSGLFNYSNLLNSRNDFQKIHHEKDNLFKKLSNMPLNFQPGSRFEYSNTGYYLLGALIERLTGKTYGEFLKENIFVPLGMNNTGVDDEKEIIENMAEGYYLDGNDLIRCKYINMNLIYSSGGMYSTVEDLFLWDQALNTGKLLSKDSIEKINNPYENKYGYGVAVNTIGGRKVIHHNGGCEGFLAEIHRYVDADFAVVVLSNYGFTAVHKLCSVIASIVFEEDYELPEGPPIFPLDNEKIEEYLGIYEAEGIKLQIKKEDQQLYFIMDDEYTLPMYPIKENVFQHTWIDEKYEVTRDDEGKLYFWGIKKKS